MNIESTRIGSKRKDLTPPCMGCGDRAVGCHGRCERYAEYTKKLEEVKEYNRRHRIWRGF